MELCELVLKGRGLVNSRSKKFLKFICFGEYWLPLVTRGEIPLKQSWRNIMLTSDHTSMEVLLFLYVCPKVELLDRSNIALFAFRLHLIAEVLLFLYVYPHVVVLDISIIAPFAF